MTDRQTDRQTDRHTLAEVIIYSAKTFGWATQSIALSRYRNFSNEKVRPFKARSRSTVKFIENYLLVSVLNFGSPVYVNKFNDKNILKIGQQKPKIPNYIQRLTKREQLIKHNAVLLTVYFVQFVIVFVQS